MSSFAQVFWDLPDVNRTQYSKKKEKEGETFFGVVNAPEIGLIAPRSNPY
jgi:hypothetical protein